MRVQCQFFRHLLTPLIFIVFFSDVIPDPFPRFDPSQVVKTTRGWTPQRGEQLNIKGKRDLKEVFDVGLVGIERQHRVAKLLKILSSNLVLLQVSRNADSKTVVRNKRHYLGENRWPARNGLDLKQSVERYAEQCSRLAKNLMAKLAVGLGAPSNTFHDLFGDDALQVMQ